MTEKLVAAEIPPGYRPPGTSKKPERMLNGCNYITYRYLDEDGRIKRLKGGEREKILALLDDDMQIKEKDDPISKLKITVANQVDIPTWEDKAEKSIFRKTH